jgi:hypothetical protein
MAQNLSCACKRMFHFFSLSVLWIFKFCQRVGCSSQTYRILIDASVYVNSWAFSETACQLYGVFGLLFGYLILTTIPMILVDEFLVIEWSSYGSV